MTTIRVKHAGADYEVIVGGLEEALPRLAALADGIRLPVITDQKVYGLHGGLLAEAALPGPILVPEGEAAKDWQTLAKLVDELARRGIKRGTPIIALGGGSVGDVAGLAASLFKRGCPVIHIPTTLLAQADSAIGGKTAIDAGGQKNLVGTFHHPSLVIADPSLLGTLDARQLRSGYAEVVKYGLIDDADFFAWCEANGPRVLHGDRIARCAAIEHCVRAKARFVAADPDDKEGTRALLNFGHTFGHAIEALAGHTILHGEAVAVGMALAFQFSETLGHCPADDVRRVQAHLDAAGLPTTLAAVGLGGRQRDLVAVMAHDKKADFAGLTLILASGIGQARVQHAADLGALAAFLEGLD
jgi:3-dehydroquinate synthase